MEPLPCCTLAVEAGGRGPGEEGEEGAAVGMPVRGL